MKTIILNGSEMQIAFNALFTFFREFSYIEFKPFRDIEENFKGKVPYKDEEFQFEITVEFGKKMLKDLVNLTRYSTLKDFQKYFDCPHTTKNKKTEFLLGEMCDLIIKIQEQVE